MNRPTRKGWSPLLEDPVPGDVVKCLDELGVQILRVVDDEAHGHCPAHIRRTGKQDRHPSWSVNTETGVHNCFSCGFRGPFTTIVEEVLGCSHPKAVEWIKVRGSIDRTERLLREGRGGRYINELMAEPEVTEADLALYVPVPTWAARARHLDPESCDYYGVLWDEDKDRWIVPIRDPEDGSLLGWQEKGERNRFFRNQPAEVKKSTTLFGLQQFAGDTAILVESPLDVVRLHSVGVNGALASFGVHISEAQLTLLVEHADRVIVALDNDRDGITECDELKRRFRRRAHVNLQYLDYSRTDAKDPGDMTDAEIHHAIHHAYSSVMWLRG